VPSPDTLKVAGLTELRKELKKLDLVDDLKDANLDVAQVVVTAAQAKAAGQGPMQRTAAATLKPSRQAARAAVTGGSNSLPFFAGAEFGAGQDVPRNTARGTVMGWNQFDVWRGSGDGAGYFLYPAIRDKTDEIVEMYGDAIEKITAGAFPD
jgi:hypothetical protein